MASAQTVPQDWRGRFEKQREVDALLSQLRALDRQRDALRAAIADASMVCADPPYGIAHTEKEEAWRAEQQEKVNRRAARRAWEISWSGPVPPGPWDADLDKHLGIPITWDLGDGYTGQIRRNRDYGWNAYITVPTGHELYGKDYDEVGYGFTYSQPAEGGGWTFGYCHDAEGGDTVPHRDWSAYSAEDGWNGDARNGCKISLATFQPIPFLTAEEVQAEVGRLKAALMPAPPAPAPPAPPPPAPPAPPAPKPQARSWAQIAAAPKKA